jgi:CBS domain containing-hemolysin-like protein
LLITIQRINQVFLRVFKGHLQNPSPFITIEELKSGFLKSAMSGAISSDEQSLISGILDLGAQPVKRVVIHRSRLAILSENTTAKTVRNILYEKKQNFALLKNRKDSKQISGIVYLRDLICTDNQIQVKALSCPPVWVPETMEIADLISHLIKEECSEACVLDEFGGFSGVFSLPSTLNDLIFDATHKKETLTRSAPQVSTKVFSGVHEIEEMDEWIPESLKNFSSDIRTINGLLTNYLGRIPRAGDRFAIDGWNFYIIRSNPTKIDSVLIHKRKSSSNEC